MGERGGHEIFAQAIEDLFSGTYSALYVIKFRGIYRDVESAMDYCYSVSETVLNVVMKNILRSRRPGIDGDSSRLR